MAFNVKKNGNENSKKDRVCMDIKSMGYEVTNVRVITDSFITFTLKFKGFALYNMRVVESKKTGEPFISVPQSKGGDFRYYNQYAVYLSDEDQKMLINEVFKIANSQE